MTSPLLKVKDFCVSLNNTCILNNLNFEVYPEEIFGVLGLSGSGKSTLAQALLKLIPANKKPSYNGQIFLHDKNLFQENLSFYRGKEVGLIFQDPKSSLNPTLKIGYQVQEVLHAHYKMTHQQAKDKVFETFLKVGLSDADRIYHSYPYQLSGGMCQRALIALAIICEPKLIIADEPTASLDPELSLEILELFQHLVKTLKISCLLISHDLVNLLRFSDRIAVMQEGKIIETQTPYHLLHHPAHQHTQKIIQVLNHDLIRI